MSLPDPPLAVALGQHPPDIGVGDPVPDDLLGELDRRKVARKAVVILDPAEGLEADSRQLLVSSGSGDRSVISAGALLTAMVNSLSSGRVRPPVYA